MNSIRPGSCRWFIKECFFQEKGLRDRNWKMLSGPTSLGIPNASMCH